MKKQTTAAAISAAAALTLAGCVGNIGEVEDGPSSQVACGDGAAPGRAPLRRLTRFEYNHTLRDLLDDTTSPGDAFPSEEIGNGFGNDADAQSVSSLLAEQYGVVGESVALRATATPAALEKLAPCASTITATTDAATEETCARTLIEKLAARAFRRDVASEEIDELLALRKKIRASATFAVSIASVLEAILQSPDFLYRIEWGTLDIAGRRRPTGDEMATRLSYFLWGTHPDDALRSAAKSGELTSREGVLSHARRMLDDDRARPVIRFFFDNLLPVSGLSGLERDETRYPTFSGSIGALMREETHQFLAYEIFEGGGTWPSALTAPYTFVNGPLAEFYGIEGIEGDAFQKVSLDTTKRLGLLTQAGLVAGTIHSNETNPVVRGSFIVQKLMCTKIPLPSGDILAQIKPPDPDSGKTARERYSAHADDPVCATCHQSMDPVGLVFENFDAVGLWRDTENGVTIDVSGSLPGTDGAVNGAVELVTKIAEAEATQTCFASNWMNFAYGRTLGEGDECTTEDIQTAFADSNYDVKALLLALTQTDAFLYLPKAED